MHSIVMEITMLIMNLCGNPDFTMVKQVVLANRYVWKQSRSGQNSVSHETDDPCLEPWLFSQSEIFYQQ